MALIKKTIMKKYFIILTLLLFFFLAGCQEEDETVNRGTWSVQTTPVTEKLNDVVFVSENQGWIAGNGNTLLYTEDGENWENRKISDGNTYNFLSIDFAGSELGLASGEDITNNQGVIFRTRNGGDSWSSVGLSSEYQQVFKIAFADENTVYALAQNQMILKSTDGGMNWTEIYEFNSRMEDFAVLNNDLWVCGKNGNLHYSSDGGTNWIDQSPATGSWLSAVYFVDNSTGFTATAYGDATVFKTSDAGNSWDSQVTAPEEYISDVFFADDSHGWFTAQNNIYYTSDGNEWEIETTTNNNNLNALYFLSEDKGYAVGFNGTVIQFSK